MSIGRETKQGYLISFLGVRHEKPFNIPEQIPPELHSLYTRLVKGLMRNSALGEEEAKRWVATEMLKVVRKTE